MKRAKLFLAIAAACAMLGTAGCGQNDPLAGGANQNYSIDIKPDDRIKGSPDAPITLLEYASMTCSHCATFSKETMPKLTEKYIDSGQVKVVFREFPLDGAARMASALARCVPEDNFFPFIDLLFANQDKWIKDFDQNQQFTQEDILQGLTEMGRFAGLSRERVTACVSDQANLAAVDANAQEGQERYGVDSTPTFILDGKIHRGDWPFEDLDKALQAMAAD